MNYYGPAELYKTDEEGDRKPADKYLYTRRNGSGSSSRIWPLGYCAGLPATTREEYDKEMGLNSPEEKFEEGWESSRAEHDRRSVQVNQELVERFGKKYHEDLHDTEQEAVECYTEYCTDVCLTFWNDNSTEVDEWLDVKKWLGVTPNGLSEPVEASDVPGDVRGKECRYSECEVIVARPTALIRGPGLPDEMHLCSEHCNQESVKEFWTAPEEAWGSY